MLPRCACCLPCSLTSDERSQVLQYLCLILEMHLLLVDHTAHGTVPAGMWCVKGY